MEFTVIVNDFVRPPGEHPPSQHSDAGPLLILSHTSDLPGKRITPGATPDDQIIGGLGQTEQTVIVGRGSGAITAQFQDSDGLEAAAIRLTEYVLPPGQRASKPPRFTPVPVKHHPGTNERFTPTPITSHHHGGHIHPF
jgi:hypothetical protein